MRVLLVDDSPAMRSFIRRVMELSGFTVTRYFEAGNGAEALSRLSENTVDLILCDINMPVMDGEEFIAELSKPDSPSHAPVVVVSTDSTSTRTHRMLELGARAYVRKPFTPEAMREALDSVMA